MLIAREMENGFKNVRFDAFPSPEEPKNGFKSGVKGEASLLTLIFMLKKNIFHFCQTGKKTKAKKVEKG